MTGVRVEIEGERGTISAAGFLEALRSSLRILAELDSGISGQPRGTLDWVITDLYTHSLGAELTPRSRLGERNVGPAVTAAFVGGMAQIEREGTTLPYLSEAGMRDVRRLLKLIGRDGAQGLVVADARARVGLSARAAANVEELIPARHQALGSVDGVLEVISIHGPARFVIYHSRTRKAVTCRFDRQRWLEAVKEALGSRVNVAGAVHYNAKGEPLRIDLADIRRLKAEDQLPAIARLTGSMPDLTGGQRSEEYVRSLRGD